MKIALVALTLIAFAGEEMTAQSRGLDLGSLGFEAGKAYPDIVLPRLEDGKPGSISEFRGKKVIVLHFASW